MKNTLIALFVLALSACATQPQVSPAEDAALTEMTYVNDLNVRRSHLVDFYVGRLRRGGWPIEAYYQVHVILLSSHMSCLAVEIIEFEEAGGEFVDFHPNAVWDNRAFAIENHLYSYVQAASIVLITGQVEDEGKGILNSFYENYNLTLQTFVDALKEGADEETVTSLHDGCDRFYAILQEADMDATELMIAGMPPTNTFKKWEAE